MKMTFIDYLGLAACCFILARVFWIWLSGRARHKGINPANKPTLFDVKRLVEMGQIDQAVRLYQKIYGGNLSKSKKAVEELERSIKS